MRSSWKSTPTPALLLALLLPLLPTPAFPQRAYQKFWIEKMKTEKEPAIVEDSNEPSDPAKEYYLYDPEKYADVPSIVVYPGKANPLADPVGELALRSYVEGAVSNESGSLADALTSFDTAMKKDPENPWLKLKVANAAVQVNDTARAQAILQETLEKDPKNFRAMLLMGEIDSLRRKYEDAKGWYTKVLEIKPKNIEALEKLAQISYEIDRDLEKTKEYAKTILAVNDRNLSALLWNAEACAFTGDATHAADLYERLIRYRPAVIPRMAEVARQLIMRGKPEDALLIYERALTIAPDQEAIRQEWEKTLREQGGDKAVREGYERLVEKTHDEQMVDLYANFLREADDWDGLKKLREEALEKNPEHFNSLMDIAKYHLRKNDFPSAKPFLDRALASNPTDADVYREIAVAQMQYGDPAEARDLLGKAMILRADDIQSMDAMATLELRENHPDKAEEWLRKAIAAAPANGYILKRLGTLALSQGDTRKAAEFYQQVLATNQFDFETWLQLAALYFDQGNTAQLDQMEESARTGMQAFPDVQARYGLLAQQYGDFERSRKALEYALKATPEDFNLRAALSRAYLHLGEKDLALKVVRDAEQYTKTSEESLRKQQEYLATLLSEVGNHEEAAKVWAGLVEKFPDDLSLREGQIMALVHQGQQDKVTTALNEIVRQYKVSKPVETELLRAAVYRALGDPKRAVSLLQGVAGEHPDDHEVWLQLAIAAGDSNDLSVAEKWYRKLIELGAADKNTYFETASNNLGYLLAQRNERLDEAAKLIGDAHDANPTGAYILDSLGWLHFRKGELDKARTYLERAARGSFGDAEVYFHLGQVYEKQGETEKARNAYQMAVKEDPNLKVAAEALKNLAAPVVPTPTAAANK